jgi:hypothetical protein
MKNAYTQAGNWNDALITQKQERPKVPDKKAIHIRSTIKSCMYRSCQLNGLELPAADMAAEL